MKKPPLILVLTGIYLAIVTFLTWLPHLSWDMLWFVLGGAVGIYFLDAAELFFKLAPSPFRSILFTGLFAVVSLFIVTSSGSAIASGLVLSLFLQLLLWQIGEWKITGSLDSWFRMVAIPVPTRTQRLIFFLFSAVFLLETYIFIR